MSFDITGLGSVADLAKGVVERFFPPKMTDTEKTQAQLQLQELLEKRENTVVAAHKEIIVAEMNQGDAFTKRARPCLVYAGLVFIFLVHVVFPMIAWFTNESLPALTLPEEFWWAWCGVCGIWVIGRSAEKKGARNKSINMITGAK